MEIENSNAIKLFPPGYMFNHNVEWDKLVESFQNSIKSLDIFGIKNSLNQLDYYTSYIKYRISNFPNSEKDNGQLIKEKFQAIIRLLFNFIVSFPFIDFPLQSRAAKIFAKIIREYRFRQSLLESENFNFDQSFGIFKELFISPQRLMKKYYPLDEINNYILFFTNLHFYISDNDGGALLNKYIDMMGCSESESVSSTLILLRFYPTSKESFHKIFFHLEQFLRNPFLIQVVSAVMFYINSVFSNSLFNEFFDWTPYLNYIFNILSISLNPSVKIFGDNLQTNEDKIFNLPIGIVSGFDKESIPLYISSFIPSLLVDYSTSNGVKTNSELTFELLNKLIKYLIQIIQNDSQKVEGIVTFVMNLIFNFCSFYNTIESMGPFMFISSRTIQEFVEIVLPFVKAVLFCNDDKRSNNNDGNEKNNNLIVRIKLASVVPSLFQLDYESVDKEIISECLNILGSKDNEFSIKSETCLHVIKCMIPVMLTEYHCQTYLGKICNIIDVSLNWCKNSKLANYFLGINVLSKITQFISIHKQAKANSPNQIEENNANSSNEIETIENNSLDVDKNMSDIANKMIDSLNVVVDCHFEHNNKPDSNDPYSKIITENRLNEPLIYSKSRKYESFDIDFENWFVCYFAAFDDFYIENIVIPNLEKKIDAISNSKAKFLNNFIYKFIKGLSKAKPKLISEKLTPKFKKKFDKQYVTDKPLWAQILSATFVACEEFDKTGIFAKPDNTKICGIIKNLLSNKTHVNNVINNNDGNNDDNNKNANNVIKKDSSEDLECNLKSAYILINELLTKVLKINITDWANDNYDANNILSFRNTYNRSEISPNWFVFEPTVVKNMIESIYSDIQQHIDNLNTYAIGNKKQVLNILSAFGIFFSMKNAFIAQQIYKSQPKFNENVSNLDKYREEIVEEITNISNECINLKNEISQIQTQIIKIESVLNKIRSEYAQKINFFLNEANSIYFIKDDSQENYEKYQKANDNKSLFENKSNEFNKLKKEVSELKLVELGDRFIKLNEEFNQINKRIKEINEEKEKINEEKGNINEEKGNINEEKEIINEEKEIINEEKEKINEEKEKINEEKGKNNEEKKRINEIDNKLEKDVCLCSNEYLFIKEIRNFKLEMNFYENYRKLFDIKKKQLFYIIDDLNSYKKDFNSEDDISSITESDEFKIEDSLTTQFDEPDQQTKLINMIKEINEVIVSLNTKKALSKLEDQFYELLNSLLQNEGNKDIKYDIIHLVSISLFSSNISFIKSIQACENLHKMQFDNVQSNKNGVPKSSLFCQLVTFQQELRASLYNCTFEINPIIDRIFDSLFKFVSDENVNISQRVISIFEKIPVFSKKVHEKYIIDELQVLENLNKEKDKDKCRGAILYLTKVGMKFIMKDVDLIIRLFNALISLNFNKNWGINDYLNSLMSVIESYRSIVYIQESRKWRKFMHEILKVEPDKNEINDRSNSDTNKILEIHREIKRIDSLRKIDERHFYIIIKFVVSQEPIPTIRIIRYIIHTLRNKENKDRQLLLSSLSHIFYIIKPYPPHEKCESIESFGVESKKKKKINSSQSFQTYSTDDNEMSIVDSINSYESTDALISSNNKPPKKNKKKSKTNSDIDKDESTTNKVESPKKKGKSHRKKDEASSEIVESTTEKDESTANKVESIKRKGKSRRKDGSSTMPMAVNHSQSVTNLRPVTKSPLCKKSQLASESRVIGSKSTINFFKIKNPGNQLEFESYSYEQLPFIDKVSTGFYTKPSNYDFYSGPSVFVSDINQLGDTDEFNLREKINIRILNLTDDNRTNRIKRIIKYLNDKVFKNENIVNQLFESFLELHQTKDNSRFIKHIYEIWKGISQLIRTKIIEYTKKITSNILDTPKLATIDPYTLASICELIAGISRGSKHWPLKDKKYVDDEFLFSHCNALFRLKGGDNSSLSVQTLAYTIIHNWDYRRVPWLFKIIEKNLNDSVQNKGNELVLHNIINIAKVVLPETGISFNSNYIKIIENYIMPIFVDLKKFKCNDISALANLISCRFYLTSDCNSYYDRYDSFNRMASLLFDLFDNEKVNSPGRISLLFSEIFTGCMSNYSLMIPLIVDHFNDFVNIDDKLVNIESGKFLHYGKHVIYKLGSLSWLNYDNEENLIKVLIKIKKLKKNLSWYTCLNLIGFLYNVTFSNFFLISNDLYLCVLFVIMNCFIFDNNKEVRKVTYLLLKYLPSVFFFKNTKRRYSETFHIEKFLNKFDLNSIEKVKVSKDLILENIVPFNSDLINFVDKNFEVFPNWFPEVFTELLNFSENEKVQKMIHDFFQNKIEGTCSPKINAFKEKFKLKSLKCSKV